jgi:uncharacterized membrane protein YhhN|nr:hypothetical protein [Propionicimonas sp.]
MSRDRLAFAVGMLALTLAGLALWSGFGQVDTRTVQMIVPVVLVVIGAGMLLLSRGRN